ncbi:MULTISPECIES: DNA cytosine methyltransferase [unclassified Peribacillus]|uniref:DNA cytosine methyltransferase n=1 Tax=unclassified Peribacillus TaxID=2675266 RepID=UPI00367005CC
MKFLDLFAGIGGFRLGMEQAGHECVGYVEWDKFARKSYETIHNTEGEWTAHDIRKVRADEIPRADAWCFGFPCTDISIQGEMLGFNGSRSSLFFATTRLIRDTEEENRPSTLFIENVKNLLSINGGTDFLKLLVELDECGYDVEWDVINSREYSVPQNRERVFVIGHIRGGGTRKVFPIRRSDQKTGVPIVRVAHANNYRRYWLTYNVKSSIECLDTMQGGGRQPCVQLPDGRIRKLTPRECWRLQGFPDWAFDKAAEVNSDSQLYKQAGNSVTVNVINEIAKRLGGK